MAARQMGRRVSTVSARQRAAEKRRRSAPAAPGRARHGKRETLSPGEKRHLVQLVACGSIFVLLVAVKLLLPGRMAQVNERLTGMLEQNIDWLLDQGLIDQAPAISDVMVDLLSE